ncbi:MAG: type II restriction endonuclease [Bacteroidota bacterium]
MTKLSKLLCFESDNALFEEIQRTFKEKITQWDYFVNWEKVFRNLSPIEVELNILNHLIGKQNQRREIIFLLKKYPEIIKAFPILLAIREKSIQVLADTEKFLYHNYNFIQRELDQTDLENLADYIQQSGIGTLLKDKKIKNLVDYVTGVEVGLDSNGRKNRTGSLMESLVENFVRDTCEKLDVPYLAQASGKKIKKHWGLDIIVDKSKRQLDFAINKSGKLYFIECNFYGGGGSKLKSTATEYTQMYQFWRAQGIEFIWITDGAGWKNTLKPLREYFDKTDYLLNLNLLKNGTLERILTN